jgi:hypothetical protein
MTTGDFENAGVAKSAPLAVSVTAIRAKETKLNKLQNESWPPTHSPDNFSHLL